MKRRPILPFCLLLLLISLCAPFEVLANQDVDGGSDHPAIARFPGFYLDDFSINDFNRHEFPSGTSKSGDQAFIAKEGRYLQNTYFLKDGARRPSIVEIIRNYESAFRRNGGTMVWSDQNGQATYRQIDGKAERWAHLEIASQGSWMRLTVVDVRAMEQKVEFSASEMLQALNRDGLVALSGILFDTGRDTIKPESEALLQEVRQLLVGNPTLKLSIDGHTDNVGSPTTNLPLSRRRSESVKLWLTARGIAPDRLTTQGFGDTRPVADNRTEEGRTKNRRVELVKTK